MSQKDFNAYALIIGIGEYHHIRKLEKTTTDAQDLRDVLIQGGYPVGNIKLLLDDQATRPFISDQLDWLARYAQAEATVLIFFAGHGAQRVGGLERGEYLCPVEADWYDLERTAISHARFTDALKAINAERLVVFLDACHSGGVGDTRGALDVVGGLTQKAYEQIATGEGRVVIASCQPDEVSWELDGMDNGLFTHYLLEGLRGKGKVADDGTIRALRLFSYLSQQVPQHLSQQVPPYKKQTPLLKAEAAADIVICRMPLEKIESSLIESKPKSIESARRDQRISPNQLKGDLSPVKEPFEQVASMAPTAPDEVNRQVNKESKGCLHRQWGLMGAAVTLLGISLVICQLLVGYSMMNIIFPSPTPSAQINPVADLLDPRVVFRIEKDNSIEIIDGEPITLIPGDSFQLKITVTVDGTPFPLELKYQYSALRGSMPAEHTGFEASYVSPNQPGTDIISVLITDPSNGRQISRSINVIIQEN